MVSRSLRAGRVALNLAQDVGLWIIGIATLVSIGQEVVTMIDNRAVTLADLLLLFIYLEVLAMVNLYMHSHKLPVRMPMYIGMVALARFIILDMKDMDPWQLLAVSGAVLILALAVLALRFGHVRYPYGDEPEVGTG